MNLSVCLVNCRCFPGATAACDSLSTVRNPSSRAQPLSASAALLVQQPQMDPGVGVLPTAARRPAARAWVVQATCRGRLPLALVRVLCPGRSSCTWTFSPCCCRSGFQSESHGSRDLSLCCTGRDPPHFQKCAHSGAAGKEPGFTQTSVPATRPLAFVALG